MSRLNAFDILSQIFGFISQIEVKSPLHHALVEACLPQCGPCSAVQAKMFVLGLFDESLTISSLHSSDFHVKKMMNKTVRMKEEFLEAMNLSQVSDFKNLFRPQDKIDVLDGYAAAVSDLNPNSDEILDREQLLSDTSRILEQVNQSSLSDYAKKCLCLKLLAFTRIVQECSFFSDDEIRRRIKTIYADFCAEFEKNDRQHEDVREALGRWARKFMVGGLFMLALTADVSEVAGLLEAPKSQ